MSALGRVASAAAMWLGRHWFAVYMAALSSMFVLWAIASPPTSVPDEPAHVVKAASVWQGMLRGPTVPLDPERLPPEITGEVLRVPASYADLYAGPCFAFNHDVTASCMPEFTDDDTVVDSVSAAGPYPPLFYAVVGWPSRVMPGDVGIYWMRLTSAAVCAALVGVALASLRHRVGAALGVTAMVAAVTPMVAYLAGSVNPNGLEIVGGLALWAGLAAVLGDRLGGAPVRRLDAATCIAGAVGLGLTRSLGPMLTVCVVAASVVAHGRPGIALVRDRAFQRILAPIGAIVVVGGVWVATSGHLGSVPGAAVDPDASLLEQLVQRIDDWIEQMVAVFGWLDTGPVLTSVWAWLTIVVTLVGTAWLAGRSWMAACAVLLTGIVAITPVIVQYPGADDQGISWQGRYGLALAVGIPVIAALAIAQHGGREVQRRLPAVVATFAVVGHLAAFTTAMRRYAVGLSGPLRFWQVDAAWSPPFGNLAVLLAFLVCLAGLAAAVIGAGRAVSHPNGTDADPSASGCC